MHLLNKLRNLVPPITTMLCLIFGLALIKFVPEYSKTTERSVRDIKALQPAVSPASSTKVYFAKISDTDKSFISNNPIFSETRRKPEIFVEPVFEEPESHAPIEVIEAIEDEPVKPAAVAPIFEINGLIQQNGMTSILIRQDVGETWKSVGDKIEEWEILLISKTAVTLGLGDEKFTMRMPR